MRVRIEGLLFSAGLMVLSSVATAATAGGAFAITNSTIDTGGNTSAAGDFSVSGTIGQADAYPPSAANGAFAVAGGFWAGDGDLLFKDGFETTQ